MMRRITRAVFLVLLICCARPAAAQGACTFSDTAMAFGTYADGEAALGTTSIGSWTGTCSGSWSIPLSGGDSGNVDARYMVGAATGFKLQYGVFQDAGYATNWGNTTTTEKTGTAYTPVTFYGQITAGQNPPPDTYTDTLSTATTNFAVSVTVVKACTISATNLAFGIYTGALIDSTATISVTCTSTTTYTVGLSAGLATGATVTTRKMQNGTILLGYSLYRNTRHTNNWGNTTGSWATGTGTGIPQALTVYGQLPAGTVPAPGAYTDTITATITY